METNAVIDFCRNETVMRVVREVAQAMKDLGADYPTSAKPKDRRHTKAEPGKDPFYLHLRKMLEATLDTARQAGKGDQASDTLFYTSLLACNLAAAAVNHWEESHGIPPWDTYPRL